MNLNNLKLGLRLGLGFGVVLALSLVIVAISYVRLTQTEHDVQATVDYERRVRLAEQWFQMSQLNVNRVMAIAKSAGQPDVEKHFTPLIKGTTAQISEIQKTIDASVTTEKGKALMAAIGKKRQEYIDARAQLFERLKQADAAAVDTMLKDRLLPASASYLATMGEFKAYEESSATERARAAHDALELAKNVLLGLLAATLAFGSFMAYVITQSVTRPLAEAANAARVIAQNDLTQKLESSRKDELGDLLRGLAGMQAALRRMVGQVRASTDSITTASSEIATGGQDLSARTEQAASNLQEAASSMEQLTGTVKQSADSARQANQLAASAAEVAARGGAVVSQVVATMDDINASSKKISDIIGVIDGIAFQTNILALNAAVEAARAGEQGRGFAVVAGEVRNLAQRSAQAAKEIKGLIGASVDKVEGGAKLVADAGKTMQEIVASVQRVSDIIGEITAASSEQSDGIGQVNSAVVQLDQMTQQNAALVEQSAAAAESLKEQAMNLTQVVGSFKLDPSDTAMRAPASPRPAAPAAAKSVMEPAKAPAVKPAPPTLTQAVAPPPPVAIKPAPQPAPAKAAATHNDDWETF